MLVKVVFNKGKMLPKKLINKPVIIARRGPYLDMIIPLKSPVKIINIEKIAPKKPDRDKEILKWSINLPMEGASFARFIAPTMPQQTTNQEKKISFIFEGPFIILYVKI